MRSKTKKFSFGSYGKKANWNHDQKEEIIQNLMSSMPPVGVENAQEVVSNDKNQKYVYRLYSSINQVPTFENFDKSNGDITRPGTSIHNYQKQRSQITETSTSTLQPID